MRVCREYSHLYVKFAKSKKRKRYWVEKITKHKEQCSICQTREKFVR